MDVIEMLHGNNNELKYQGKPMIRRVHLLKARNKRIINDLKSIDDLQKAYEKWKEK